MGETLTHIQILKLMCVAVLLLVGSNTEAQDIRFPEFRLPYPSKAIDGRENRRELAIHWSSGPHEFGNLDTRSTFEQGLGSGIDFAGTGEDQNFPVLAMADGVVIFAGWGSFGNQVAIRHESGVVTIYGHLQSFSPWIVAEGWVPDGAQWALVSQGEPIGRAGNTNAANRSDMPVHLHVELRDGSPTCNSRCVRPENLGGNPLSWHSKFIDYVDGWMVFEYRESESDVARAYNYDGVAIKLSNGDPNSPYGRYGFQYQDIDADNPGSSTPRRVYTWLPRDFECPANPVNSSCEAYGIEGSIQFAGHGIIGGGGVLTTTNEISERPPESEQHPVIQAAENLRVRSAPSIYSNQIGTLYTGATRSVIGKNANEMWLQISHDGQTGWVCREFAIENRWVSLVPVIDESSEDCEGNPTGQGPSVPDQPSIPVNENSTQYQVIYLSHDSIIHITNDTGQEAMTIHPEDISYSGTFSCANSLHPTRDGRYLALRGDRESNNGPELAVLDTADHHLLPPITSFGGTLDWHPNGRYLIHDRASTFTTESLPSDSAEGLWAFDLVTREDRLFIPARSGYPLAYPLWSPDGTRIAFREVMAPGMGRGRLVVANADGDDYLAWDVPVGNMSWSPDGTRIAFDDSIYPQPGPNNAIYVANADGSDLRLVISDPRFSAIHPQWSPDGQTIAFEAWGYNNSRSLWIVEPDGTNAHAVTLTEIHEAIFWSFDSSRLLVNGENGIELFDLEGRSLAILGQGQCATWRRQPESTDEDCTVSISAGDTANLVAAIDSANAEPSKDVVCLDTGTYTLTTPNSFSGENGPNGLPIVASEIVMRGAGSAVTRIERSQGAAEFRILEVAPTGTLTLEDLSITGGYPGSLYPGGAIYNNDGLLTIERSGFYQNNSWAGGAIENSDGYADLSSVVFEENTAHTYGGALANGNGTIVISGSSFFRNAIDGTSNSQIYHGGAISNNSGTVTILDSTFSHNSAVDGGSALSNSSGQITISNSCIFGNFSPLGLDEREATTSVLNDGSLSIDASNNWWGDESGPSGAGPGLGDAISQNVNYLPFVTQQLLCLTQSQLPSGPVQVDNTSNTCVVSPLARFQISRGGFVLEIPLNPLPPQFEVYYQGNIVPDADHGVRHDGYAGDATETSVFLGISTRYAIQHPRLFEGSFWEVRYPPPCR